MQGVLGGAVDVEVQVQLHAHQEHGHQDNEDECAGRRGAEVEVARGAPSGGLHASPKSSNPFNKLIRAGLADPRRRAPARLPVHPDSRAQGARLAGGVPGRLSKRAVLAGQAQHGGGRVGPRRARRAAGGPCQRDGPGGARRAEGVLHRGLVVPRVAAPGALPGRRRRPLPAAARVERVGRRIRARAAGLVGDAGALEGEAAGGARQAGPARLAEVGAVLEVPRQARPHAHMGRAGVVDLVGALDAPPVGGDGAGLDGLVRRARRLRHQGGRGARGARGEPLPVCERHAGGAGGAGGGAGGGGVGASGAWDWRCDAGRRAVGACLTLSWRGKSLAWTVKSHRARCRRCHVVNWAVVANLTGRGGGEARVRAIGSRGAGYGSRCTWEGTVVPCRARNTRGQIGAWAIGAGQALDEADQSSARAVVSSGAFNRGDETRDGAV